MITTIETRLKINLMEEHLLNSSINLLSSSFRKAWRLFNNLKYSKVQIYHELMKTNCQRKAIISETLTQIINIAKENKITEIAIENLDFSSVISNMNSGHKSNNKYNEIISQFAKTQFKELLTRKCQRLGFTINLVNPVFSSIGGFIKYGLINKVPVDLAASHWLARQALFGVCYKTENNINYIKKYEEAITLPYRIKPKQSKKLDNLSLKWKDLALALGKDRRLWVGKTYDLLDKLNVVLPEQEEEFNLFPDH